MLSFVLAVSLAAMLEGRPPVQNPDFEDSPFLGRLDDRRQTDSLTLQSKANVMEPCRLRKGYQSQTFVKEAIICLLQS